MFMGPLCMMMLRFSSLGRVPFVEVYDGSKNGFPPATCAEAGDCLRIAFDVLNAIILRCGRALFIIFRFIEEYFMAFPPVWSLPLLIEPVESIRWQSVCFSRRKRIAFDSFMYW